MGTPPGSRPGVSGAVLDRQYFLACRTTFAGSGPPRRPAEADRSGGSSPGGWPGPSRRTLAPGSARPDRGPSLQGQCHRTSTRHERHGGSRYDPFTRICGSGTNQPAHPFHVRAARPRARDVQIEILYCGVCHSDIHQARNEWGGSIYPMVPGHEIVGRVTQVGRRGDEVQGRRPRRRRLHGRFLPRLRRAARTAWSSSARTAGVQTYNSPRRTARRRPTAATPTRIVVDEAFVLKVSPKLTLPASRRCSAPASPRTRRCATGRSAPARRSASSDSAGWGTWA